MEGRVNPAFLTEKDTSDPGGFISVSIISVHAGGEVLRGAVTEGINNNTLSRGRCPARTSSCTVKSYLGVAGCLLEAVVLSGSIFGWASIVYVLEKDGIFGDLCNHRPITDKMDVRAPRHNVSLDHHIVCPEQSLRLSIAYSIGMGIYGFGVFPMGAFFDRFGLRMTRLLCMSMGFFAFMLIGFTTKGYPWLCVVGGSVLGLCCSSLVMIHANVTLLAGPRKGTLTGIFIGLLNTAFTFQVVKMAHDVGFDRRSSMLVLSVFWVMGVPLSWLLPHNKIPRLPPQKELVEHLVTLDGRSLKDCVLSKNYILFMVWFAVLHACWQLHTSSYNQWVTHIVAGNESKVSFLTDFQAWFLVSALILAPLSGMIIDYTQSVVGPSVMSQDVPVSVAPSMMVACMSALCMMVASLWNTQEAIFASMVMFVLGKSFTYTSLVSYLSNMSPSKYFGTLFGITYVVGGLAGTATYPYLIWIRNSGFLPCHVFILCTVVVSFSCPVWSIYNRTMRPDSIKDSSTLTSKM